MSAVFIIGIVSVYFLLLIVISRITSKNADNDSFFTGNKKSPWFVVAFGMIGASLSGITFISVPGWVQDQQFAYMQMVLGYLAGYLVIATILMPLYYRLNLTSIYTYLERRFGFWPYKTGAVFFLISRIIGASFRLFIVAKVFQITIFDKWNIPFFITVLITIILIFIYTNKGGIKTIIWTDTLQTLFMLTAVGVTIYFILFELNISFTESFSYIKSSSYSKWFYWDNIGENKYHFIKQFFSGAFITIVMTGLDQDMMQKNLSCKNIKDAQKNMLWFSVVLVFVNLAFLSLGVLLLEYAHINGITLPTDTDQIFPYLTVNHLPTIAGICFIIGLIAAAYSSADSALTALTTSFSIDFLNINNYPENRKIKIRKLVHISISLLFFGVILLFNAINDDNIITALFKAAGYTYGPLLGLFAFGLFTRKKISGIEVLIAGIISPIIWYVFNIYSYTWFNYKIGFEILIYNGVTMFIFLYLISIFQKKTV